MVIGFIYGDARQQYLYQWLKRDGYEVKSVGLFEKFTTDIKGWERYLDTFVSQCTFLVGGIPFVKKENLRIIQRLIDKLSDNNRVIAGMIPKEMQEVFKCKKIPFYDLMKDEKITFANAIATAEGAIAKAITMSPENLQGSHSLVLGFGKCGKLLAQRLHALQSNVTVCARKEGVLAEAAAYGYSVCSFETLGKKLKEYEYIFNTIPAVILTRERLSCVQKDVAIIDIASAPGGVDYAAAQEWCIPAELYLGIPGKIAPKASAKILYDAILPVIEGYLENNSLA
ncbi:MAG: dipicolinate synthase subunit DpsA [Lachnospiraceae bacterium]